MTPSHPRFAAAVAHRAGPDWAPTNPAWCALTLQQRHADLPDLGLTVCVGSAGTSLTPADAADLRDWLEWWLGGHAGTPPHPDRVRGPIYTELARLRALADELRDDPRAVTGITHGVAALNRLVEVLRHA